MIEITDEEIKKLDKVLIRGNKEAKEVQFRTWYYGIGGSNSGGPSDGVVHRYVLSEMDGAPIQWIDPISYLMPWKNGCEAALVAVVDDVAYIRYYTYVIKLKIGETYGVDTEIAYDTEGGWYFKLV